MLVAVKGNSQFATRVWKTLKAASSWVAAVARRGWLALGAASSWVAAVARR